MPINIYREAGDYAKVAWLCDDEWSLPAQIETLETWLRTDGRQLDAAQYVADIGFMIRDDASGGGAALSPDSMRIMADKGIWLYLSEYTPDCPKTVQTNTEQGDRGEPPQ